MSNTVPVILQAYQEMTNNRMGKQVNSKKRVTDVESK